MIKNKVIQSLLLFTMLFSLSLGVNAKDYPANYLAKKLNLVDGLIVKMKAPTINGKVHKVQTVKPMKADRIRSLSALAGVTLQYKRVMSGGAHVLNLPSSMSAKKAQMIADKMANDPAIEYVEPDIRMYAKQVPNDPKYVNQWHYKASATHGMNLPLAWDVTTGSASVVTAVIDTGVLGNHADLTGRVLPGYDMIGDVANANDGDARDADASDPGDGDGVSPSSWHGTHVAGTIGAASNNGIGVAGIDWTGKILPLRVLGIQGGLISDIADAIRWASGLTVGAVPNNPNPAQVLNLSLGGDGSCSATTQSAIDAAIANGSLMVVAAGNESSDTVNKSPANCVGVLTVAAHGNTGRVASYSNFGAEVDVMAPGGDQSVGGNTAGILSTLNTGTTAPVADDYVYYQGTSMATPHIAGLAALVLAVDPTLSPAQVKAVIGGTTRPFVANAWCASNPYGCGAGIADAHAAVLAAATAKQAPTALARTVVSNTQVDLTWTDNSTVETGYQVERRDGATGVYNVIATGLAVNTVAYSDTTTAAGTTYYYRVRAVLAGGATTHASNEVNTAASFTPPPPSADDHGNTIATATLINATSSTAGAIEIGGDNDVFKIVLTSAGDLNVKTTGNTDTFGILFDSSGGLITFNDDIDFAGGNYNFGITQTLNAGTYYVDVSHFSVSGTGSYTLVSSFVATPAPAGGGGCIISSSSSTDAMLMLLALLALTYWVRCKVREIS